MPWKVFKDGDRFCVHKLNADGSKGDTVACHDTEAQARKQQAALYVNTPQERSLLLMEGLEAYGVVAEAIDDQEFRREFSTEKRRELARSGAAMPDGAYPIESKADLSNAIQAFGRGATTPARKAAIRRHIMKRARALGATDMLPESWRAMNTLFEGDEQEYRNQAPMQVEIKGRTFEGYAAVFDVVSDLGSETVSESVQRGAFRKVLSKGQNVPFLYDHGPQAPGGSGSGIPMATTAAGTLRLAEDNRGLHVEVDLPTEHPEVRMLQEQVERGEVGGMSWGFVLGSRENFTIELRGDRVHRNILGMERILDVSPTWNPAYEDTMAEVRSMRYGAVTDFLALEQQLLGGERPQPKDGVPAGGVQEEHEIETRSADVIAIENANRKRRLEIMRLSLPKEFR